MSMTTTTTPWLQHLQIKYLSRKMFSVYCHNSCKIIWYFNRFHQKALIKINENNIFIENSYLVNQKEFSGH